MAVIVMLVITIGLSTGNKIEKVIRQKPQPSISAASSSSLGTPLTKLQKVMMVKGRRKDMKMHITEKKEP